MQNVSIFSILFGCLFLCSISSGKSQDFNQQVRGKVFDELSNLALDGAKLTLSSEGKEYTTTTDEKGKFRFEQIPVGRYLLNISREEYSAYHLPDILISAGKELILEIGLSFASYEVEAVEINNSNSRKQNIQQISTRVFTVEESQRIAATYYDPARLVATYPGIAVASDESNNLVIRGNSPNGVLWRLEGVDIVNPNHSSST